MGSERPRWAKNLTLKKKEDGRGKRQRSGSVDLEFRLQDRTQGKGPANRVMSMRWILTWKEAPEGTKAKARLVAEGFTDPDLLTVRAEVPTLTKLGRRLLLQLICSSKFKIEVGDVSTAFLQGDKKEQDRDVYPTADLRKRLGIDHSHILKLIGCLWLAKCSESMAQTGPHRP